MADEIDLQEVHDFLVTIAQRAGERILAATGPASSISATKSSGIDLVTETDQAVEKMVSEALREKYPEFKYVPRPKPHLFVHSKISLCVSYAEGT